MSLKEIYPNKLEQTLTEIYNREVDFGEALIADAEAEHAYKIAKATAFLSADGTEKAREAKSIVESDRLMLEHFRKKATKEFTREKLRDAQDALSARQSLLAYEAKSNFGYAMDKRVT